MTPKVPKTPAKLKIMLRELSEDLDAPAEWHYSDVAEGFQGRLNTGLAAMRIFINEDDVPDDFALSAREYSATGKTIGQPAFDRLRRAVRVAGELAEDLPPLGVPENASPGRARALHPDVQRVSGRLMANGHASQAIFEAFKAVNARVKRMSALADDGKSLMAKAFSEKDPVLRINEGKDRSDSDEQEGFKLIFMGAMQGIRNPKAHEVVDDVPIERAAEYLGLASLLMRRLDDAQRTEDGSGAGE